MLRRLFYVCLFQLLLVTGLAAKELPDFTELAEKQSPVVVNISSIQKNRANQMMPGSPEDEQMQEFFKRFGIPVPPGMPPQNGRGQQATPDKQVYATGSGFIVSADGFILTNAHVVKDADEVMVKLNDKREFKAKVIGIDLRTDVAVLKVNANNLPKVNIGNPDTIKVGEWVAAIGAPFGLENTMTVGIVSAKGRALPQENFVPFIQTDVAINPGNSGGPLFNLKGEVIGINSQIYSRTGGYMGLSFAIPINVAMDVMGQLKSNGKVIRGWLGIAIQEVTKELSESFGMKNTNGALVAGIEKGAPAEKGGLLPGDVITKFDGKVIESSSDLPKAVGNTKPGKTVVAEVFRKGSVKTLNLTVGEMPSDQAEVIANNKTPEKAEVNRLGLVLKEAPPQQRKK